MRLYPPARRTARERNYLLILLTSLVFTLLVIPMLQELAASAILWRLGLTVLMIVAAIATERRKLVLLLGLAVVGLTIPLQWSTILHDKVWIVQLVCVLEGVFFFSMAALILTSVVSKHLATLNSIYGAISAYLLMGLAWALFYLGVTQSDPGSLTIAGLQDSAGRADDIRVFSQFVYFSFSTMSTLGYGDLVPLTPLSRALAWMQSVTGQFYMAVMVAWLVSEMPRRRQQAESERSSA